MNLIWSSVGVLGWSSVVIYLDFSWNSVEVLLQFSCNLLEMPDIHDIKCRDEPVFSNKKNMPPILQSTLKFHLLKFLLEVFTGCEKNHSE